MAGGGQPDPKGRGNLAGAQVDAEAPFPPDLSQMPSFAPVGLGIQIFPHAAGDFMLTFKSHGPKGGDLAGKWSGEGGGQQLLSGKPRAPPPKGSKASLKSTGPSGRTCSWWLMENRGC